MREIKFRAWDTIDKKYWYSNKEQPYYFDDGVLRTCDIKNAPFEWEDVEQYTGLKDKNGKDIYEGDIVLGVEINGVYTYCAVEFHGCGFMFKQLFAEKFMQPMNDFLNNSEIEIIGNIHKETK
jgi:uncharacterized phage protein (TIGR01671 family)